MPPLSASIKRSKPCSPLTSALSSVSFKKAMEFAFKRHLFGADDSYRGIGAEWELIPTNPPAVDSVRGYGMCISRR